MLSPTYEDNDHGEPELIRDHQQLYYSPHHVAKRQDQRIRFTRERSENSDLKTHMRNNRGEIWGRNVAEFQSQSTHRREAVYLQNV